MKAIKFELTPQELDIVMNQLVEGPMKVVNNVVQKMMTQANDPVMQGGAVAADSKSGEPSAEPSQSAGTEQKPAEVPAKTTVKRKR